jgi:hypothetical protein
MALTTTTLSAACAVGDEQITVTSASGFAMNSYVQVDNEFMQITSTYNGTATIVPVRRGVNGTLPIAHPSGANATAGTGSDFGNPNASVSTAYALAGRRRKVESYSAAGAITLPASGEDTVAIINGTNALAMTLANPGKDQDGSLLYIASNGKAAHTVTYTAGLGNASTGYTVATFTTGSQQTLSLMAINGIWNQAQSQFSGTLTAILIALA